MRRLGADVEDPDEQGNERNKEDGWITVRVGDEQLPGVLEIKSARGSHARGSQFGEDGIRQLNDWKMRGVLNRNIEYKGIFIGNSGLEHEPCDRDWPFSDSWTGNAKMHNICAITSEHLYVAYEAISSGQLDREAFWVELFSTNGVFDLTKHLNPS